MSTDLWDKALKILEIDTRVNSVIYSTILCNVKQVDFSDNVLILSCRNDYELGLVKGKEIDTYINNAVNIVSDGNVSVKYIIEGDEKAKTVTSLSEKRAIRKENLTVNDGISSDFTFDNFIVGDCNRFAHASAISVANNPGKSSSRNPLYLWGNSGLGKTHLMKAIGYSIRQNFKDKIVLYTTCEEFTNAYIACMKSKQYEEFRAKYRGVDVLLIDDIQFLIGKEGIQMEFFNTFESLITSGKQIVITCDKAPKNLTELDSRLTSRFQNGLMMDIQPPDFETRKAIFLNKVQKDGLDLSDDIINYVCENVTKDVRDLNGAYNIVSAYYVLSNGELTLDIVESKLSTVISPGKNKKLTVEIVIDAVSKYYDISAEKMIGKLRNAEIVNARSVAMYICRDLLEMQYEKIGSKFGGRKHTTVMNACNNVEQDENLMADIESIKKRIME
ncbi:MAG: chromosomal replication initiator protein DnaA [Clostridiales bacterium]|nr:chromosomal replication initiator protein DnaA [Clostridiales bacterium]